MRRAILHLRWQQYFTEGVYQMCSCVGGIIGDIIVSMSLCGRNYRTMLKRAEIEKIL